MQSFHKTVVVWFRRGVRIRDNHALTQAVKCAESVVPVFVLDPAILTHPTTAIVRTRFLFESLAALDTELRGAHGRLIIRHGKPVEELTRLVKETGATAIFHGREYEPYGRDRDKTVAAAMRDLGVSVTETDDHLLTEPGDVMSKAGTVYTVFTPYKRVWFEQPMDSPLSAPDRVPVPGDLHSEPIPGVPESVGVPTNTGHAPAVRVKGGESEGAKWLEKFLDTCVSGYDTDRDFPATEGTSRLSAYLRSGVLSPRQVFDAVRKRRDELPAKTANGANTFLTELAWRDFYYQILFHFPHVATGAFKPAYNAVPWENDDDLFAAWCEGRTGYPIVDAGMRQMNAQGWMHNRLRMVTASFLTKDLLTDWRRGEAYFMERLVDGDQAPNNGGWQWAAGSGTDAAPYFRVFNPTAQAEKFDPKGTYIRRWVPEYNGIGYPAPMIDHAFARQRVVEVYKEGLKKTDEL